MPGQTLRRSGWAGLAACWITAAQASAPLTVEDLVMLKRLSDPQASPDGRHIAYVLRETDLEADRGRTHLWLIDLGDKDPTPRQLTQNPASDTSPRWAPDGRTLYFLSARSGTQQVWRVALAGGEAVQVTDYPLDVGTLKIAPAGDRIAISMDVLPECANLQCTKDTLATRAKDKATARVYDRLFIRHWDTWRDGTQSHLFSARIGADGKADTPLDLSKTLDADVPSKPMGGDEEFTFSPDSSTLVFSARVAGRTESWSTHFDLFQVPVDHAAAPQNLTVGNLAWATQPVFLKNGDLAYLATDRPGFESDRFHIVVRDAHTGRTRSLSAKWDRSVIRLDVARDGRTLLATADDVGQEALFSIDPATGTPLKIVASGQVSEFTSTADSIVYGWANIAAPEDLYLTHLRGGAPRRLTAVNGERLGARTLSDFEQFSFKGWNDETVYGYVVKPYGFEAGKRFPLAFFVHGGPESAFGNAWAYRWNMETIAGRGYAVVFIDFHGSPGYGQAFTDAIDRNWGVTPFVDLQKGLSAALERYPWIDGERACALGASFGGYMMNWIEGNWPDRFRCLVNHDGTFDQRFQYYSTEEIWFGEWEFGGTPFDNPQGYEQWNPIDFISKWRTPMLVVHGERDFRIPDAQGIAAFTALQRRGIESKLLIFPDENHWVLKPADSVLWYRTVLGWLDAHLKP